MSEGPIRRARQATTTTAIPSWKIGQHVTPDQCPPDCTIWTVTATDGVMITLTATNNTKPQTIRRHARSLKNATK